MKKNYIKIIQKKSRKKKKKTTPTRELEKKLKNAPTLPSVIGDKRPTPTPTPTPITNSSVARQRHHQANIAKAMEYTYYLRRYGVLLRETFKKNKKIKKKTGKQMKNSTPISKRKKKNSLRSFIFCSQTITQVS